MVADLPPAEVVEFLTGDFRCAWDALAGRTDLKRRGNFMFAGQCCVLLEVVARICTTDSSGAALRDVSAAIASRDARYFSPLPGVCFTGNSSEFILPCVGPNPGSQLLAAVFDLVRNGQLHHYQQLRAELVDGKDFVVELSGADTLLAETFASGRPKGHLHVRRDPSLGDIWVGVRPDVLFHDIADSVRDANLLGRGLTLPRFRRPGAKGKTYQFSSAQLESALKSAGH